MLGQVDCKGVQERHFYSRDNFKLNRTAALAEWRQQANSGLTGCQTKHVCSDAQTCGRVAKIAGMVNVVGANVGAIYYKIKYTIGINNNYVDIGRTYRDSKL